MAQQQTAARQLLGNARCHAILSTTDLARSKVFWTDRCGLQMIDSDEQGIMLEAGVNTRLYVYQRQQAPKAENTVAGFDVPDLDATVENLRNNGVVFEEYNMPNLQTRNGIASSPDGTWRSAWFKDPDGNIIAVGEWKR